MHIFPWISLFSLWSTNIFKKIWFCFGWRKFIFVGTRIYILINFICTAFSYRNRLKQWKQALFRHRDDTIIDFNWKIVVPFSSTYLHQKSTKMCLTFFGNSVNKALSLSGDTFLPHLKQNREDKLIYKFQELFLHRAGFLEVRNSIFLKKILFDI